MTRKLPPLHPGEVLQNVFVATARKKIASELDRIEPLDDKAA
jgi:hypothetical protein